MIKNYSDHTIAIKVGGIVYLELPAGWSDSRFENDPEFEEFLRKRYPELNPQEKTPEPTSTMALEEEVKEPTTATEEKPKRRGRKKKQ